ncbi:MAG TPA: hypothetical protein VG673_20815, partial [Actinomycetota bacterium]|nr:hypothetical protein [Actinomycetota bacterium]
SLARHNLAANPQISMHLERGDQVVIGLQQHQAEDRERRLRILIEPLAVQAALACHTGLLSDELTPCTR